MLFDSFVGPTIRPRFLTFKGGVLLEKERFKIFDLPEARGTYRRGRGIEEVRFFYRRR